MTRDLYRKLWEDTEAKIREADAKVLRLQTEIENEQREAVKHRKLQAALAPFMGDVAASDLSSLADSIEQEVSDNDNKPIRHADVAKVVLEEAGRSLHISAIISGMIAKGHQLPADPSQRQSAVYSAMLRRPKVFVRVGAGEWSLVGDSSETSLVPTLDFSQYEMSDLARIALETIKRAATATELAETLEGLGYEHRSDKRGTATSIHKAMARNPDKFQKANLDLGTWKLRSTTKSPLYRNNESVDARNSLFSDRED